MDYYSRRSALSKDIYKLITDKENIRTRWSIAHLEIEYGKRFGATKSMILKILEPYEKKKYIEIGPDNITILDRKSPEVKPVTNSVNNTTAAVSTPPTHC